MKTRIISAAVGILLFVAILLLSTGLVLSNGGYPIIMSFALSALAAVGTYEILHNTSIVKNNIITAVACSFSFMAVLTFSHLSLTLGILFYFIYVAAVFTVSLFIHDKTNPAELAAAQSYPLFIAFGFSSINLIINEYGLFFFLLIFIFAWASDTFAYFTGVFFGKHKLCPALSPKKTIEGAIGGIVGCVGCTVLAFYLFNMSKEPVVIVGLALLSVLFSVLGMVGDISASYIKRAAGIKDYGNLMPGHGGVLDRFDSVLLIAPVFYAALYVLPFLVKG